jgi:hypothetical protein
MTPCFTSAVEIGRLVMVDSGSVSIDRWVRIIAFVFGGYTLMEGFENSKYKKIHKPCVGNLTMPSG